MIDKLFGFVLRATSLAPRYNAGQCLVVTKSVGGCTACRDICPHDAVTIDYKSVTIDDIDCTGCGLCVQACPGEALEARVSYNAGGPLRCSQVKGTAQEVHCLARLEPSDVVRLAGRQERATLARGDCSSCPVGSSLVPDAVAAIVSEAVELAALRGRELEIEVRETDALEFTDGADPVSRRELLRGGWRGVRTNAADVLAPFDPGGDDEPLPLEMQKRHFLIASARPEPEERVPWELPRVADGCILCPVCTNVCPTDAFRREFDPPERGGATLWLEPDRCNGCEACVQSCPVRVISLDDVVTWAELSGGPQPAFRRESTTTSGGTVARSKPVPVARPPKIERNTDS